MAERRHHVLLVEDHPFIREIEERALRGAGYRVAACDSVPRAIALARDVRFDLLVTDGEIGDRTGEELIESVRRSDPGFPVVFASSRPPSIRDEGIRTLRKPFVGEDLVEAVSRALGACRRNGPRSEGPRGGGRVFGRNEDLGGARRRGSAKRPHPFRGSAAEAALPDRLPEGRARRPDGTRSSGS